MGMKLDKLLQKEKKKDEKYQRPWKTGQFEEEKNNDHKY